MKIKYVIIGVLAVLIIALAGSTIFVLNAVLTPDRNSGATYEECYDVLYKWYPETKPWVDSLRQNKALKDTTILAQDGDKHHALFVYARIPTNKVAVLVHGYNDNAIYMLMIAKIYAQRGFNVFIPELHGCGKSEGKKLQMGWKDRKDVLEWMGVANKLFADSTKTTQMVLHGVSMGAATVMCVAGDETPEYAKCFVEDCGYTSVWDEFKYFFKKEMGLPAFPLLNLTSSLCKIECGWGFKEASPISQVRKCKKPMMFIHGSKDDYVPFRMVFPLYKAKTGAKDLFVAPGSKHSESFRGHREEYTLRVMKFVDKYIK